MMYLNQFIYQYLWNLNQCWYHVSNFEQSIPMNIAYCTA